MVNLPVIILLLVLLGTLVNHFAYNRGKIPDIEIELDPKIKNNIKNILKEDK
jgi:hypothetical protein